MRNLTFNNESIYHIYNRGVEKRTLFLDKQDYYRFIHDLYEFNDKKPAQNVYYRTKQNEIKSYETGTHKIKEPLVEIYAFCLMPNHYHLMIKQITENGVSNFMKKLGVGYSMYFNQKYERSGVLFQGRFKAVKIEQERHFIHLPYYIHLNPLKIVEPKWENNKIKDWNKIISFLDSYRWSSYLDYTGKRNFPSVIKKDFLSKFFGTPQKYRTEIITWLKQTDILRVPVS
jgi:putative transposase